MGAWVGFDFDGTLVGYPSRGRPYGDDHPKIVALLREVMDHGIEARIFSARAGNPISRASIQPWIDEHGLSGIAVTDKKDFDMVAMVDDLAISVDSHTGELVTRVDISNRIMDRAEEISNGEARKTS